MTIRRARFVQDAKLDPGRFYRNPADIIRDRRLSKEERLEVVIAWEQLVSARSDEVAQEKLAHLRRLRGDLEQEPESAGGTPKRDPV
jgi:hypothetical protein